MGNSTLRTPLFRGRPRAPACWRQQVGDGPLWTPCRNCQPKSALLRFAADLAEANERQAAQLVEQQRQFEAQAPAVKLADDFLATTRAMSLMDTARHLRLPIRDFFQWLERDGVCFRKDADGPWVPYASFIRDGRLVYQVRVLRRPKPGKDEPLLCPRGIPETPL